MIGKPTEVVITGVGPVTSIGVGHEAVWQALARGQTAVQVRALPVDVGRTVSLPLAAMLPADNLPDLAKHHSFLAEQEYPAYRDLAYTLLAIEVALRDAGLEYDRQQNNIGAVQVFEAPGVERTVHRLFEILATPPPTNAPPAAYDLLAQHFYSVQPFVSVHLIGKAFGLRGFSTSVHNACASGAFALEIAAARIRSGQADAMIVAGGEAFDTAVRLEWFRRLDLYAQDGHMAPFDASSSGFYVGEGAAALVLESAERAAGRGAEAYATYAGGGFAQQSWKQVMPDVRALRLRDALRSALAAGGIDPSEVDLIVPHGASTTISDGYEAACLLPIFGDGATSAVATVFKPYFGHMLASSGLIELIGALLALKHQTIPGTPGTAVGSATLPVPLIGETTPRPVRTLLKLSTGFTGHDAALLLRR